MLLPRGIKGLVNRFVSSTAPLVLLTGLLTGAPAHAAEVALPIALFGRLHFPLLHFPIVLLLGVLLLEVLHRLGKLDRDRTRAAIGIFLTVGAAAAVVTALAGLAYAAGEDFDGPAENTFLLHRGIGIGVAVASVLLLLAHKGVGPLGRAYLPLLVLAAAGVLFTGHEGGELVHGEGFYTRPLYPAEKESGKGGDDAPVVSHDDGDAAADVRERHPEGPIPEKPDYAKDIQPMLQRSCVKCHGPEKRKSGLRLDVKRFAFKGGESGPVAVVPGNPDKSLVYTMCTKPADDEDLMPTRGKLLALSEIETLKRWIEQGAVWPDEQ